MNEKIIVEKIAAMAKKYTESHIKEPTRADYLLVENAALLGASLALQEMNDDLVKEREEKEKDLTKLINPEPPHEDYN